MYQPRGKTNFISPTYEELKANFTLNKSPLILKEIGNNNAYFATKIKYPVTNRTSAEYDVSVVISLTDERFKSSKPLSRIFPTTNDNNIRFIFVRLISDEGFTILSVI